MNYQRIYDNLVSYRQSNPASGYTEQHHILMRSMGGSNAPSNLVVLTGREHWIAHLLLHKIYRNSQTVHACHMMAMRCEERGIPQVKNSRMYESIRKECARLTSRRNSLTHRGSGNSQYGTRWICNLNLKENKKIKKDQEIPEGWILGSNKWLSRERKVRERLEKRMYITDGIKNRLLYFKDQLPIQPGWSIGMTMSEENRKLYRDRRSSMNKTSHPMKDKTYRWINDGKTAKKLFSSKEIPSGWKLGRA
jgi:hypothetical protein